MRVNPDTIPSLHKSIKKPVLILVVGSLLYLDIVQRNILRKM